MVVSSPPPGCAPTRGMLRLAPSRRGRPALLRRPRHEAYSVVAGARRRMALVETRLCHFYFEGVREPTEPRRHEMQLSGFSSFSHIRHFSPPFSHSAAEPSHARRRLEVTFHPPRHSRPQEAGTDTLGLPRISHWQHRNNRLLSTHRPIQRLESYSITCVIVSASASA